MISQIELPKDVWIPDTEWVDCEFQTAVVNWEVSQSQDDSALQEVVSFCRIRLSETKKTLSKTYRIFFNNHFCALPK